MAHELPQVCLASSANVGAGTLTRLASDSISTMRPDSAEVSSIDRAFRALVVVTQLTAEVDQRWEPQHGLIFSSAAVAVAEDYFRSILTKCVEVCPLCADRVAVLETKMEYVFSGSVPDAIRGILDRESFSSSETVKSWSKKIAGADLGRNLSLGVALSEFDRVCHVRHSAMHSGGYVSARNAAALGVPSGSWISFPSPAAIHEIISVVAATLRSFNQDLFEIVLGRWIDYGKLSGDWERDKVPFSILWGEFRSEINIASSHFSHNGELRRNAYHAYQAVRPAIRARNG